MKVPVIYQPEPQEVEVEISAEDIHAALLDDPEYVDVRRNAVAIIRRLQFAVKAIPLKVFSEDERKNIAKALRAMAEAYEAGL